VGGESCLRAVEVGGGTCGRRRVGIIVLARGTEGAVGFVVGLTWEFAPTFAISHDASPSVGCARRISNAN
jgi:hypothetical protein